MSKQVLIHFEILKKEVVKTLQNSYAVNSNIKNWKGQEIIYLQDGMKNLNELPLNLINELSQKNIFQKSIYNFSI